MQNFALYLTIVNILGHSDLKMLFEHYAKWLKDKAIDTDTSINLYKSFINKDYKQVTLRSLRALNMFGLY